MNAGVSFDTTNQKIGTIGKNDSGTFKIHSTQFFGGFLTNNTEEDNQSHTDFDVLANGTYYRSNVSEDDIFYVKKDFPSDTFPSDWAVILGIIIGVAVAILGIIGNSMTIGAYKRNRKLRTSFNFLITNLCAVDLIFSAVVIPIHLPMMFARREICVCDIVGYFYYWTMSSSAVNLVCIAINRYVGIVHSKKYRTMFTRESVKYWLIGIWLSSPLLYLPLVIVRAIRWKESSLRCETLSGSDVERSIRYYRVALNVVLEFLPTIALIIFYRAILRKVKKCRKTVEHYPITNTPSNAPSGMPCAMCSNSKSECNHDTGTRFPGIPSRRRKTSFSINKCETVIAGEKGDVSEGKKAIIMAYLQVPSTSISPRKNPTSLYKRSPPQTRTMVVEEVGGPDINKVTISGTTSSPNLTKQIQNTVPEPSPASIRGRRLGWCQQRSFSTGDEELEPEPGMIGDDDSDLPEITSFELKSCVFGNTTLTKQEKEKLSNSHAAKIEKICVHRCEAVMKQTRPLPDEKFQFLPVPDEGIEKVPDGTLQMLCDKAVSDSRMNKKVVSAFPSIANIISTETASEHREKSQSLPGNDFLSPGTNIDPIFEFRLFTGTSPMHNKTLSKTTMKGSSSNNDSRDGALSNTSIDSGRRRARMLKRQSGIEEDIQIRVDPSDKNEDTQTLINSVENSSVTISENHEIHVRSPISSPVAYMTAPLARRLFPNKQVVKMLSPPETSTTSEPSIPSDNVVGSLHVPNPTSSGRGVFTSDLTSIPGDVRRAKYAFKPASSSSDKGYTSQLEQGLSVDTGMRDPPNFPRIYSRPESRDEGIGFDIKEGGLSKRIMYRRGASDTNGKRWFKHFRKSKNWSVTSLKQSKYRIRGSSGLGRDTMIKIVIDHATEEAVDEHSSNHLSPCPSQSPETIPEQGVVTTTDRNEKETYDTPQKQNLRNNENEKSESENKIQKCFRSIWKKLFHSRGLTDRKKYTFKSPIDDESNCDVELSNTLSDWPHEGCDEGMGSSKASSLTSARNAVFLSNASSMWSGIANYPVSPKLQHQPIVMLPIPSFPIKQKSVDQDKSDRNSGVEKRMCSSPPLYIDSEEGRRKFTEANQIRRVNTFDSVDSTSRRGSPDTDVISPRENEALLARRRKMNDSSQFLRVQNTCCADGDCNVSLDLNSIDLGRRWSGQSDAISIYSGRCLSASNQGTINKIGTTIPPPKPSASIVSVGSQVRSRKQSKSSTGSSHRRRGRRPTIYERFSGKKASVASSSAASSSTRHRRREAERKLAYSGLFICIAFALYILPSSIVDILQNLTPINIPPNIQFGVVVLSWLHVVVNPLLYGFMNPQYRVEYRKICKDARRCLRRRDIGGGLSHGKSALVKTMRQQSYISPAEIRKGSNLKRVGRNNTKF